MIWMIDLNYPNIYVGEQGKNNTQWASAQKVKLWVKAQALFINHIPNLKVGVIKQVHFYLIRFNNIISMQKQILGRYPLFFFIISIQSFLSCFQLYSQENENWGEPGEHLVCQISKDYKYYWKEQINWPIISKNWKSVACKVKKGARWSVLLNGKSGTPYAEVRFLQFSPMSDTLIYIGTKGANQNFRRTVSVTKYIEKEERLYDEISPTVFNPEGKLWTYRIRDDIDWYVVLNGKESSRYDYVDIPQFSSDGSMLVFKAKLNGKYFLVVNGFEGKQFDDITGITFNPSGNDVAYWGKSNNIYYLTINDSIINHTEILPSFPNPILYSSNGKTFGYCINEARNGLNNYYVIQNDIYSKPYDKIDWKEAKFSPDGNSLIYPAGKGNSECVVLNLRDEPNYEAVSSLIFSYDNFSIMYFAYESNKWFAVINKRKEKRYDSVKLNIFQPRGDSYVYAAKENNKWFLVLDGMENEKKFDDIKNILYNSSGEKLAYIARTGELYSVILNDIEGNLFPKIDTLTFTPDGNSIAYIIKDKQEKFIVINGYEGKRYKDIYRLEISPDGKRVGYFALDDRGNILWVVESS
jgi:hypothetical protein